jgi:hypothetical protein
VKSGKRLDSLVVDVDDGVVAQHVAGLAHAEDEADFRIDPEVAHEVGKFAPEIVVILENKKGRSRFESRLSVRKQKNDSNAAGKFLTMHSM